MSLDLWLKGRRMMVNGISFSEPVRRMYVHHSVVMPELLWEERNLIPVLPYVHTWPAYQVMTPDGRVRYLSLRKVPGIHATALYVRFEQDSPFRLPRIRRLSWEYA